jgi:hypothetical protein
MVSSLPPEIKIKLIFLSILGRKKSKNSFHWAGQACTKMTLGC